MKVMVQRVQRAELQVPICFTVMLYEPTVRLVLFTLSFQFVGFIGFIVIMPWLLWI